MTWTLRKVLEWTTADFKNRALGTPRLDAELLIAHALSTTRLALYLDLDRPLGKGELESVRGLVARRRAREPVAYILGQKEFYGRPFIVSNAVLVPRPDTETLVERALRLLRASGDEPEARVLDLCTGSGAIALTLAIECPHVSVDATDVSPEALSIARTNAEQLGVAPRMRFFEGDLFDALPSVERYALITANPPYIPKDDVAALQPEIALHEPHVALAGGHDGLDVHRRIASVVAGFIEPNGNVLVEVGAGQAARVTKMYEDTKAFGSVHVHADLAGIERVVEARARNMASAIAASAASTKNQTPTGR